MALCKFRGMLVLMETKPAVEGSCPDCGSKTFDEPYQGWINCSHCDFAVLESHVQKIRGVEKVREETLLPHNKPN